MGVPYAEANESVFTDGTALGSLVDPEDFAEVIAYLVSDAGQHVTAGYQRRR